MNRALRFLALPLCGGSSVAIGFCVVGMFPMEMTAENIGGIFLFFIIGSILTMIVGWPLLALLEWQFHRYRLRYVLGGLVCSLLAWLLVDGAFFSGAWKKIWTSSYFWTEWAPRRMVFFSLLGLGAGALYTFIVAAIDRKFPLHAQDK